MKKVLIILILANLLIPFSILGQKDILVDAKLVKKNRDTINCKINPFPIINFGKSVTSIDINGEKVIYSPSEIKEIFYADSYYKVIEVHYEYYKDKNLLKVAEPRFCEAIVIGKTSLYKIRASIENPFYIIEEDGVFYHLKQDKEELKQSKKYQHKLMYLSRDFPDLRKKASSIRFSDKSLGGFINDYNNLKGGNKEEISKIKTKSKKKGVQFLLGVSYARLNLYEEVALIHSWDGYLLNGSTPLTLNINLGVEIERYLTDKISFLTGLNYYRYKGMHNQKIPSSSQNSQLYAEIKFNMIEVPLKAKFNFLNRKNTPFIYLAFSPSVPIGKKYKQTSELVYVADGELELPVKNLLRRWSIGFGYSINLKNNKSLVLNCDYSKMTLLNSNVVDIGDMKAINFRIGFNISK